MVDSIGAVVVGTFGLAAEAAAKGAAGAAVIDGYDALKSGLSAFAKREIAELEPRPRSIGMQIAVAEIIDAQSEETRTALCVLAATLVARLRDGAPAAGLDIDRLAALEAQLSALAPK
ncbi:hypothetical protein [Methylosinus sp. LW3]|uniref:hypothetical protein n=1 Tax=Methylosinus sp. LW3 TaxID=107635 RepID=UPI000464B620|nr:hypothetical protein [Methylosinus sp. LW3]